MFALLTAAVVYAAASSCSYGGYNYQIGFCSTTSTANTFNLCDPSKPNASNLGWVPETDGKICQRKNENNQSNVVCIGNGYTPSSGYSCCSGKAEYKGSTLTCVATSPTTPTITPGTTPSPTPSSNLRCSSDGWEGTFSVNNATSLPIKANDFGVNYTISLNGSETEVVAALIPRLSYTTFSSCNPTLPTLPTCDSTCTVNDWIQQYRSTLRYSTTTTPTKLTDMNTDSKIDLIDFETLRNAINH